MHYIMTDNNKLYYSMFYAIIGDIIGFGNGFVDFNFKWLYFKLINYRKKDMHYYIMTLK